MALQKPKYNFKGIELTNAYIRVSQISYRNDGKMIDFWLNLYANKEGAENNQDLEEIFAGSMQLKLGKMVPDVLSQIYTHVKEESAFADSKYAIFADCIDI